MKDTVIIMLCAMASILWLCAGHAMAGEARVAVAANFVDAAKAIAQGFEARSGHRIVLASGATGKHYAQIKNGAPFAAFLAADAERPELLEREGLTVAGSRFTYALGTIVLWSPRVGYVDPEGEILKHGDFRHLAIANPKLAPYGRAAQEVLVSLGLWEGLQGRMVRGENIAQTFQFVGSGNAELGFVASSQVRGPGRSPEGSWWEVPRAMYQPIEQQAVLLKDDQVARAFLQYLVSDEARAVIRDFGYGLP